MRQLLLLTAFAFALLAALSAGATPLPRPAALEPDVRFWTRVFTEVDTHSGFIHDNRRLDIVYETLHFDKESEPDEQKALLEAARQRTRATLLALADGVEGKPTPDQQRILRLWGGDADPAALRAAAERVRFQRGQADKFRAGLIRSGAWLPHIHASLAAHDVPRELAALPHVESSFNPGARSHAGAAGLWQFMESTGRQYLRVDTVVDERLCPFRSTEGAARLLADNYRATGTWPLAITAYNHGAGGMRRAVQQLGTDDIAIIVRGYDGKNFGFASRNFYVSVLAALDVERNAERHFGRVPRDPPARHTAVELPAYLTVSAIERGLRVDRDQLRRLNPALRKTVWDEEKRVPRGFTLRLPEDQGKDQLRQKVLTLAKTEGASSQTRPAVHVVKRGETLGGIASRYKTSVRTLQALNGLRNKDTIRVGQTLRLPATDQRRTADKQHGEVGSGTRGRS